MSERPSVEIVEWVDSCSPSGWTSREGLKGYTPDNIVSIGFVLEDGKDHLTLAPHWASSSVDGVMCIPKCAITKRSTVQLPTRNAPIQRGRSDGI